MFNIIVAVDMNDGIGKNNKLPWNISSELKYFKKITTDNIYNEPNIVIMGRKTFDSIPNNFLPNRINIVISTQNFTSTKNDIYFVKEFGNAIKLANALNETNNKKIWVIGGSSIYKLAIRHKDLDKIYRTIICKDYECDKLFKCDNYKIISSNTTNHHDIKLIYQILKIKKNVEIQYLSLLENVLDSNSIRSTRNGNTYSLFGNNLKFDVSNNFPLLTTKKMFWRGIVEELLFFIRGETNTNILSNKGIKIWDQNTSKKFLESVNLNYEEGMMGPMYGYQWRYYGKPYGVESEFNGIDQFKNIIEEIKTNPTSRRIVMTDFNPLQVNEGVLYPCHSLILQFYVDKKNLSVNMYQRSADLFLGLPFNIASTSLLLYIVAKLTNLKPYEVNICLGDCHIYSSHLNQVKTQIDRLPYTLPELKLPDFKNIDDVCKSKFEDYKIDKYFYHKSIKASMIA